MNIQEFLHNYSSIYTSEKEKVIVLKGYEYTPLFFSQLLEKIKQDSGQAVKVIAHDTDLVDLFSQLSTSFLGTTAVYWLGEISNYRPTDQKKLQSFLQSYQGPHLIMLYVSEKNTLEPQYGLIVQMEKEYSYDGVKAISALYPEQDFSGIVYFLRLLFQKKRLYGLEELALLLQYQTVLGKNQDLFFEQWFSKISVDDYSLFQVSELFFAKKNLQFVEYWNSIYDQYSEMFWVSFWSDQLFKAYFFISQMQKNKIVAKNETYGLPFSFLKVDWKKHNLAELQACHQKIYHIDNSLKNGASGRIMFTALLSCL